jgi:hypothetical protein
MAYASKLGKAKLDEAVGREARLISVSLLVPSVTPSGCLLVYRPTF